MFTATTLLTFSPGDFQQAATSWVWHPFLISSHHHDICIIVRPLSELRAVPNMRGLVLSSVFILEFSLETPADHSV